jgi:hypothetical protein
MVGFRGAKALRSHPKTRSNGKDKSRSLRDDKQKGEGKDDGKNNGEIQGFFASLRMTT